jgi:hypothetical protein
LDGANQASSRRGGEERASELLNFFENHFVIITLLGALNFYAEWTPNKGLKLSILFAPAVPETHGRYFAAAANQKGRT